MTSPVIYRCVDTVLNTLRSYKRDNLQAVEALLQVYEASLKALEENYCPQAGRQPLIVLEGLDGCGKSTICKKLTSKLNARKWCTPPESIRHLRHLFDDHPELRNAYYAMGNYIAALECAAVLKSQPVVMDRFWHSTAAYAIAQAAHDFPGQVEIPPQGDSFYQWPNDLMKPDVVLFLDVNEKIRMQRLSRRTISTTQENLLKQSKPFRDNVILAYKNMVEPSVIFINANSTPQNNLLEISDRVKHLFK